MIEKINFEDVSFSYDKKHVLEQINLDINTGDFVGIVGENGSGKTTLLNLLLGLYKPTKGKIINSFKKKAFLSQLNFTDESFFPATIEEIVALGLKTSIFSFTSKKDKRIIYDYLCKFDLLKYKGHQLNELSGGEQQKVRLVKALISKPTLLVLDEPTSGIDKNARSELIKVLKDIHDKEMVTIIIVSHLQDDFKYCKRILELDERKLRVIR